MLQYCYIEKFKENKAGIKIFFNSMIIKENFGAPGEIRTPDHLVRSQVLYPTELRALILLAEREGFEPSMEF